MTAWLGRVSAAFFLLLLQAGLAAGDTAAGLAAYAKGDYQQARTLLLPEAHKGDAAAQTKYGQMLANGVGGTQDAAAAFRWFKKAADQGYADAYFYMGIAYSLGDSGKQDDKIAADWFRKAAEKKVSAAEYQLAIAYLKGEGVDVEPLAARFWMKRAADHGEADAAKAVPILERSLADLFAKGPGRVAGGDGSTQERALLLPDAKDESAGVRTEHAVVRFFFPGWAWRQQALLNGANGHAYDLITVQKNGVTREIYFDINNWFGNMQ